MGKNLRLYGTIALFAFLLAGCSLISTPDVIVGKWQQASVNGVAPITVNVIQFTEGSYTGSTAGVVTNSGTWTKSGSSYTLTGSFFGFISSVSTITPAFSNSDNTMSYTDGSGYMEVYSRQ